MLSKCDRIIDDVCKSRRVFRTEVLSRKRYRPLVAARYEIAWRIAYETKLNSTQIGAVLGRHRSSVLYGLRKMGWSGE